MVRYGSGTSAGKYFYKEKVLGERRYKTRCIPEVTTIEEAVAAAVEIAFVLHKNKPLKAFHASSGRHRKLHRTKTNHHKHNGAPFEEATDR